MSMVTWEYYSSLFAKVPREEFDRLESQAERYANRVTGNRVSRFMEAYELETATAFQTKIYDAVCFTLCEVVNKLYVLSTSGAGSGLSSVSNDGYTESYKVTTEEELQAEIDIVIRMGLSGTGMAGVL